MGAILQTPALAEAARRMNALGAAGEAFVFLIDFECQQPLVLSVAESLEAGLWLCFPGFQNVSTPPLLPPLPQAWYFEKTSPSLSAYAKGFALVQAHLRRGDSYLVNYAARTAINTNLPPETLFWQAQAKYKVLLQQRFVCFSPETFVQINGGQIRSFPMKGTIRADLPDAAERILSDAKEQAEHHTIVDLIRNDLSQVAKDVHVARFRYLDRLQTSNQDLLQVSSEVVGTLPPDYATHIGSILCKLLPAGSISGAPKRKTVEIIQAAEQQERGYYTGIAGYFDGQNLDTAVMIRFVSQEAGGGYFYSGGGITVNSRLEDEYQELIDKVYVPIVRKPASGATTTAR
ncbi:aminodeoxychorismate synthase component I [Eisenibacter elegans]|jgi:para-aminobenzoate synthetase component 1|uniref:aminodeoxychorismate synthase component I n=1 Tax=Eisenibacter elegans TaxID=997 RepID=UPI0004128CB5|nr:aminodeoxychorismate synthase component I [Eisenibacter elegans]